MNDTLVNYDFPSNKSSYIKVLGVGGGGGNAVNYMFQQGITDVDFVICNTDLQALEASPIPIKIQLGPSLSEGRGAGSKPARGKDAAIESSNEISDVLSHNTKMVFITAGMGGGTGTGAAPIIAQEAQRLGILTVGIVTLPFLFEGEIRFQQAIEGIKELKQHVDALLIINNEKLIEMYGDLGMKEAFTKADDILTRAAKGIAEIITIRGYVNVDFEDVKSILTNSGVALMGSAQASGDDRALLAIKEALTTPLLNNNNITGAANILLNITSGNKDVTGNEVKQITNYLRQATGNSVNLIYGQCTDPDLEDQISITIIATGFSAETMTEIYTPKTITEPIDEKKSEHSNTENEIQDLKITVPEDGIIRYTIDKTDNTEQPIVPEQDLDQTASPKTLYQSKNYDYRNIPHDLMAEESAFKRRARLQKNSQTFNEETNN